MCGASLEGTVWVSVRAAGSGKRIWKNSYENELYVGSRKQFKVILGYTANLELAWVTLFGSRGHRDWRSGPVGKAA